MSLLGVLNAASTGLMAQGFGMSVTSQNAQNAGTEGYTRRDVRLAPIARQLQGGGGVRVRGSRRIMDSILERRLIGSTAAEAEGTARYEALGVLDRVLREMPGGLNASLDDFETALVDLTDRPASPEVRLGVLAAAERLSTSFIQTARELENAKIDIEDNVRAEIDGIGYDLETIAALGTQIQRAEVQGREAPDLRDQRDQLVRELSEKLPITTVQSDDGGLNVLLGGLALVTAEGQVAKLSTRPDPATGDLQIVRRNAGLEEDVTGLVDGGRLGGLIAARDGALADAASALDQLAFDTASAYNAVHSGGFGSDGVSGRDLFTTSATAAGAAAAFAVSTDVSGQPERIAAATDPALAAGDNRNALALTGLAEDSTVALGGTATLQAALGRMIGDAGQSVRAAGLDATFAADFSAQLQSLRDSVSGVSIDEEMINLAKYQRGYSASLRVVQVADQMLQELVNLKR